MSQETRNAMMEELEELVGQEEAAQYSGLPKKAIEAILSAKRAEAAAKAEAAKAKEAASAPRGRKRKRKDPQLTKEARATRRWIHSDSEGMVSLLADLIVMDPSLSESECRDLLGIESKQNGYVNAIRAAIRSLYNNGKLSSDYFIEIHNIITEKEEIE